MDVVSASPLRAGSVLWQGTQQVLTVVCKATFKLTPGEASIEDDAEDINPDDAHWDDDPTRSLFAPSDLVPFKARADVILVGDAFAPRGEPVRSLVARMVIGEIDKAIEVHQDRAWRQDGSLHEGARFARMAIRYERAAGGPETSNPVGMRSDAPPSMYGTVALPNFQPLGLQISSRADVVAPIGFGPIAPMWPSRREKLGRLAATWSPQSWNQAPLPRDIDPAYFNCAPRDQQVDELRINERIVLENLHPEHPRLVTSLPGVRPRAFIELAGRAPQEIGLRCETLWIDTGRSICTLTWRGHLENPPAGGRVRVALERPGQALVWPEIEQPSARTPSAPKRSAEETTAAPPTWKTSQTMTLTGSERASLASITALPFGGGAPAPPTGAPPAPAAPMAQSPRSPSWLAEARPGGAGAATSSATPPSTAATPFVAQPAATPFVPQPPPSAPFASAPPPSAPSLIPPTASSGGDGPWVKPAAVVATPPLVGLGFRAAAGEPERLKADSAAAPSGTPWSALEPRVGAAAPLTVGQAAAQSSAPATPSVPSAAAAVAPPPTPSAGDPRQTWAGKALQLVWFEPESLPRLHRKEELKPILRALEERRRDDELDDPSITKDPAAEEDRREVFEVLARGHALDEPALNQALERAVRDDGKFIPPLALIDGEVRCFFDELETLRATLTIAAVFAPGDEPLKTAIADAREFLRTPDLRSPPGVTEGYTTRIQEALKRAKRAITPSYLDEQTERVLVEARHYQLRTVYGAPHLRAQLQIAQAARPWPLYIPEAAAPRLPMFARFTARVLAEIGFQENQYEAHPTALRVLAIARVTLIPGKTTG